MRKSEKAKLKDDIIRHYTNILSDTISNTSKELSIDYDIAYSLIQDLIFQDFLTLRSRIASKDSYYNDDMIVIINPKGRHFLNHEGGSIMLHKKNKRQKIWMIAKISAATANAAAIVVISIWGITKTNDAKQFERKLNTIDSIMSNQSLEIDKLKNTILVIENDSISK